MRVLALLVLATSVAAAEHPRDAMIRVPPQAHPAAAVSSHIIYLHRCPQTGCPIHFGPVDDSRTDTSSIAQGDKLLAGFSQSDAVWDAVVSCVKATYAAFDVTITDVDPGNVPHFEEMIGGKPAQLRDDIPTAGGVAPFACGEVPNGISFTFDVYGANSDDLCWTVGQETAHTFGLEHEYLPKDPMTYIGGDLPKRFQWVDAPCGTGSPGACTCAQPTQNSYRSIYTLFGVGAPTPPAVAIKQPADGHKVTPSFKVSVDATDDAAIDHVELWIDGAIADVTAAAPYVMHAPQLALGAHALEVHAIDVTQMSSVQAISIVQGPPCNADGGCDGTDVCVMGDCVPGPGQPGGLGSMCQANSECLSMQCTNAGEAFEHCTSTCDPGTAGSCPNDFDCLTAGSTGVCWPSSGGCCSASGNPTGSFLVGAGVLAIVLRRRRRS